MTDGEQNIEILSEWTPVTEPSLFFKFLLYQIPEQDQMVKQQHFKFNTGDFIIRMIHWN